MNERELHSLIKGARITSLGTLVSRILGMVRDMATAALFGMSYCGVMDAFVTAFRIPNTFRRLFGEGALAASFLPVLAGELEKSRPHAWRLTSVTLTLLALLLTGLVALIELGCGLVAWFWRDAPGVPMVAGLTAVMMPYMVFMCMAAQAAAALQLLEHFSVPALAPALLNVCWLLAVWCAAPWFSDNPTAQVYIVAAAVLAAGVLQLGVQLWMLRRLGFRFAYEWRTTRSAILEIVRAVAPMTLGLAITQINTLADSFIAWGFAAPHGAANQIAWLPAGVRYPLSQGAAASIYYGERLYEFPLAILGIAVATAIYPLLSRHAARSDHRALGADLTLGLRLVLFLGAPAAVGLVIVAEPLARFLFQRGHFTPDDTLRAARVIAWYAAGVWAFCAVPVLVRGYYALGDRMTPVRIGAVIVLLNITLDLALIWPFAEAGLAMATSFCAVVQSAALLAHLAKCRAPIHLQPLFATAWRTAAAAVLMAAVCWAAPLDRSPGGGELRRLLQVVAPALLGAVTYFGAFHLLGGTEHRMLLTGLVRRSQADVVN